MVCADHVELTAHEPPVQLVACGDIADRRVDLVLRSGEAVDLEHEVVHRDLGGEARIACEVQSPRGGEMADVDVGPSEVGCETGDRGPLGLGRAVAQMVPAAALLILLDEMVVLGVDAHPPASGEHVADGGDKLLVVIEQDVPRGGAHEQLESDHRWGEHPRVDVRRDSCEQPVVGERPSADGGLLLVEGADIGHGGLGVGHVEDTCNTGMDSGRRPGREILLLRHPGVPEVNVRVYETGQQDVARPELDPPLAARDVVPDGDDLPVGDPDLGVPQLAVDERPSHDDGLDVHQCRPSVLPRRARSLSRPPRGTILSSRTGSATTRAGARPSCTDGRGTPPRPTPIPPGPAAAVARSSP